jgi:type IX secretion system PorP/SprF family membrane protein
MKMKRIQKIAVLFTTLLVMGQGVNAQDYAFSQFYANPLYLNPALAGSKVCPRFSLNYRNQWPGLVSAFTTVSASYDQYFERLHGGIGAYVLTDRQGDHGALKTTHAAFMYSFRFQVSRTVYINAALQASLVNKNLDWSVLRFPDQIDPDFGFIFDTKAVPPDDVNLFYADFNAGVVAYSKDWYAGVSVAHLTQPDEGFYGLSQLPMKITVHGGGLINLAEDQRRTSFLDLGSPVVSPNLIYQHQGGFNYFNYGLYLDWIPFMVGAWFRHGIENADAFTFLIGIQQPQFKLGYSYDVTVSKLSNQSHGSHEITLGFMLPCPDKPHRVKTISCPSF